VKGTKERSRVMRFFVPFVCPAFGLFAIAAPAAGQDKPASLPAPLIEGAFGYAGFLVDEATLHHTILGGGARMFITSRLSVGPEFVYMKGPDLDRDLFFTGVVTVDLLPDDPGVRRTLAPFLVVSGGVVHHADRFDEDLSVTKMTLSGGGGVRISAGSGFFIAPEIRLGREPFLRLSVSVGSRTR
jgi:hypothetical protein